MPNPTDFVRRIAINSSAGAYVEILTAHECNYVTVRQLAFEAQVIVDVRHRTIADPDSETEQIPAGALWEKGREAFSGRAHANQFRLGDTIGFFRSNGAAATLVVREHTLG